MAQGINGGSNDNFGFKSSGGGVDRELSDKEWAKLERDKKASLRKSDRLERERLAFRKEAIRKSRLCDHFVGECYESLARNVPREVYHLSEARKRSRNISGPYIDIWAKDFFRWIYKYCPMCGVRINTKKLLSGRKHASRGKRTWVLRKIER